MFFCALSLFHFPYGLSPRSNMFYAHTRTQWVTHTALEMYFRRNECVFVCVSPLCWDIVCTILDLNSVKHPLVISTHRKGENCLTFPEALFRHSIISFSASRVSHDFYLAFFVFVLVHLSFILIVQLLIDSFLFNHFLFCCCCWSSWDYTYFIIINVLFATCDAERKKRAERGRRND